MLEYQSGMARSHALRLTRRKGVLFHQKMVRAPPMKTMNRYLSLVLVVLFGLGLTAVHAQSSTFLVKATLSEPDQKKVNQFLMGKNGKAGFSYDSPLIDSDSVLGAVIAYRALALGGLNPEFSFVDVPNSARERDMVKAGEAVMAASVQWDYWFEQYGNAVYRSSVVIDNGLTEKGLYTTAEKSTSFKLRTAKDLAPLSVVSTANWVIDWATLKKLGLKATLDSPTRTAMFKVVAGGRADATLQSFSNLADMGIEDSGVKLVPIRGIKVALNGARAFMVSKANNDGKKIFEALEKGLAVMKGSKEIDRALQESGFLNPKVRDWTLLKAQ